MRRPTTSQTDPAAARGRDDAGFSLVELLVSLAVVTIVALKLGEDVHVVAAPGLPGCLPPGVPDDSFFRMSLRGWTAR
jgi:prepilin-type N-terminal cleavage/methylation domain-containing protein